MIKEKAYAKINLYLDVLGKRQDGFHDLEMVMASIDLYDVLTFKLIETDEVIVDSKIKITDNDTDNLVYKVARYLQEEFEVKQGAYIKIDKKIPIAGGLAGGSADAAAALRGLNKLWKLQLSLDELAVIGLEFGSDIPFCVYNQLCIAKGRGEDLFFFKGNLKWPILLINPNVRMSTKDVFNNFKKKEGVKTHLSDMKAGIYNQNYDLVTNALYNALEPAAFELEPKISQIKKQIQDMGVDSVLMSGSGATIFVISKDKSKLKELQSIFNDFYFLKLTKIR